MRRTSPCSSEVSVGAPSTVGLMSQGCSRSQPPRVSLHYRKSPETENGGRQLGCKDCRARTRSAVKAGSGTGDGDTNRKETMVEDNFKVNPRAWKNSHSKTGPAARMCVTGQTRERRPCL